MALSPSNHAFLVHSLGTTYIMMILRKLFYSQTLHFSVFTGSLCGLCGNFNSVPRDDMTTKDGQVVSEPQVFGSSWRVGGKNACSRPLKSSFVQKSTQCSNKGHRIRERMCKPLRQQMFAACHKKLNAVNFVRLASYYTFVLHAQLPYVFVRRFHFKLCPVTPLLA